MTKTNPTHLARCRCGATEVGAWGNPIVVNACYCDDCQLAAQRLTATELSAASSASGGTEFILFRRDRIACTQGAEHLQAMRLTDTTKTRRMIAGCCATPMYMAFDDKRPWVSAFRANFGIHAPPVEMRICTRFRRSEDGTTDSVPSHPGYPPAMMVRLLLAGLAVLISRPVDALP